MAMYVFDKWSEYGSLSRPDFDDTEMDEAYDQFVLNELEKLSENLVWMEELSEIWYEGDEKPSELDKMEFRDKWVEICENAYDYVVDNY